MNKFRKQAQLRKFPNCTKKKNKLISEISSILLFNIEIMSTSQYVTWFMEIVYQLFTNYVCLTGSIECWTSVRRCFQLCQCSLMDEPLLLQRTLPQDIFCTNYFFFKRFRILQRNNSFLKLYFPGLFGFPYRSRVKS